MQGLGTHCTTVVGDDRSCIVGQQRLTIQECPFEVDSLCRRSVDLVHHQQLVVSGQKTAGVMPEEDAEIKTAAAMPEEGIELKACSSLSGELRLEVSYVARIKPL